MALKQALPTEFRWLDNDELCHDPTGSKFLVHHGRIQAVSTGLLLYRLRDGCDFDLESILDLAWKLAEQRAAK